MALQLQSTITLNSGNASITVFDVTGDYSLTNLGGWGTPNPATTDVTASSITISIQGYNSYAPVTVDITAKFADLFTTGIIITAQDALNLPYFPDGLYTITYNATALSVDYSYADVQTFFGIVECCVKKAVTQLQLPVIDIKKVEQIGYMRLVYEGMLAAACCGNTTTYLADLKELNKICGGCGDSSYVNSSNSNDNYSPYNGCGGGCQ